MENFQTPYNDRPDVNRRTPVGQSQSGSPGQTASAPNRSSDAADQRINPRRTRKNSRTEIEKARDRLVIADMYMNRHMTQNQIARELGLSQQQVSLDLQFLKKQWQQDARSLYSDAAQEQLDMLDEAAQLLRQAYQRSVETADDPEFMDIGQPDGKGGTITKKVLRTRKRKPYSVAAAAGLIKAAKIAAEITGTIKQAGVPVANNNSAPDPLAGLTHEERCHRLGAMLVAAAERARAEGKMPPLPEENRIIEAGPESGPALPAPSPMSETSTPGPQDAPRVVEVVEAPSEAPGMPESRRETPGDR